MEKFLANFVKPSRAFLFVITALLIIVAITFVFMRRVLPAEVSSNKTAAIDNAILQKEAELDMLIARSSEEDARIAASREVLSATRAAGDVAVPGVRIETTSKGKLIVNEYEGYALTIPTTLILARSVESSHLEFHDQTTMCQGDPSCPPVLRIDAVAENLDNLSLADWLLSEEAAAGESIYSPRTWLTIHDVSVAQVAVLLPEIFDGYEYYFAHRNKVYALQIARVYHDAYKEAIYSLATTTP